MENLDKVIDKFLKEMFPENITSSEGELFVLFSLMYYMTGYFGKGKKKSYGFLNIDKKRDVINLNWMTPKGRTFRHTYTSLYYIFEALGIEDVKVIFHREIYEQYKNFGERNEYDFSKSSLKDFYNGEDEYLLFKAPMFLFLESDILEYCEIVNDFNTEENIRKIEDMIDESITLFMGGAMTTIYGTLPFEKQKEILLDKIAKFHNFYGESFNLKEKDFWVQGGDNQFLYIYFIVFLRRFEYIKVFSFSSIEEIPLLSPSGAYLGENEKYSFHIKMTDKLVNLVEGWIEIKSIILDKIFSDEYKQLTIKKKDGKPFLIEGSIELDGDKKLVDLKSKYPHSTIETEIYEGKVTKYKIKEKTRLDKKQKDL